LVFYFQKMADAPDELLTGLLKDVSRSVYLSLRVLPGSVRSQIGLAYLLARMTDTIADTGLIPVEQRLHFLQLLRERIQGTSAVPLNFGDLAARQGLPAERVLLEKAEASLALLAELPSPDRQLIREVLSIITGGQELDLRRFAGASSDRIVALRTAAELDDYTYRVAGCVGEFWTKICRAHVFPEADVDDSLLLAKGVQFGKGLQLVNVLRDLPADLNKGRCYLPEEQLTQTGLKPADLLEPDNESRLRPIYNAWLDRAEAGLLDGWVYTNTLPWKQARVRLGCAWLILIGVKTIALLRQANVLDGRQRVKISRNEVYRVLARSVVLYPWPGAWRKMIPARATGTGKAVASGAFFT
jgi:farnesyl-diphosphate farnesyltransferase